MTALPKLVVGNWKMHGLREHASHLARAIAEGVRLIEGNVQTIICPPFTQLAGVHDIIDASGPTGQFFLGAQDCHTTASGPFTGDISATMLADLGTKYVILGHSERRQAHGETSQIVCKKVQAAEAAGLIPIVCVGETLAERREGRTASVLAAQIESSLTDRFTGVLAYEPVWAIGSGIIPPREELERTAALIVGLLQSHLKADDIRVPILYGGSVTASQAPSILSIGALDGVLVGSASLEAEGFLDIIRVAASFSSPPLIQTGSFRS